jgi:type I restriction enzyme S subunit
MSYPRHKEYCESAIAWVGEMPVHWQTRRLKFLFALMKRAPTDDEGVVTAFRDGQVTLRSNRRTDGFTNAIHEAGYQGIRPGDLVIHAMDAFAGAIGVSDSAGKSTPVYSVCTSYEPETCVHYYAKLLRHMALSGFVESLAKGIRERSTEFRWADASEVNLPLPPPREQHAINTFLDHETAKIDALVEEQRRLIELLKEKRQAVISQAVTKGLDPGVPMKDSGVEWLGKVPAHWEIGGLTRFIGPVVDYRGRTPTKVDEGVFLVTARNIRNGKIDYTASEEYVDAQSAESLLDRGRPEIGDLLFTMEAPLGQVALIDRVDIALAQRVVKFRGRPGVLQSNFLLYWFMGDHCQARLTTLATGSTALGIKASKLGMIECLVPPLDEQAAIVRYVEREFEALDALIEQAQEASSLLVERRSALISAAVTGKIDVRGLTPQ